MTAEECRWEEERVQPRMPKKVRWWRPGG